MELKKTHTYKFAYQLADGRIETVRISASHFQEGTADEVRISIVGEKAPVKVETTTNPARGLRFKRSSDV